MLRRAVLPLALLLTTLAAQQPAKELQKTLDAQLLASLLPRVASTEAADVAWGAHLIGHYRLAGATKELREALQSWRDRDGEPARQVRLHLIDALLTLETKLPADEFVFLLDDPLTRVPAFLCAALDVQGNAELLAELVKNGVSEFDLVPFAAGGLLVDEAKLRNKPAAFARHLLTLARTKLSVSVTNAKSDADEWDSAVGLGGAMESRYAIQRGFPLMPNHTIRINRDLSYQPTNTHLIRYGAHANDDIWHTGPDGVIRSIPRPPGGRRHDWVVIHSRKLVRSTPSTNSPTATDKQLVDRHVASRWLERMASHSLPSSGHYPEVQFTDVAALGKEVRRLHAELQACGNGLVEALIAAGWLPKGEPTTFVLPVDVEILDRRSDRSKPLPSAAELLGTAATPDAKPR